MSIIKSRGTAHSNQVRELILSDDGRDLADIYTAGGEVLMGTMRWEKESAERVANEVAEVAAQAQARHPRCRRGRAGGAIEVAADGIVAKQVERPLLARTTASRKAAVAAAAPHARTARRRRLSVVIKALREADLRLEELTAGEVDTVSDREGRSYLLQHAQDQLRGAEAAKQAAILNALPAHIILLDMQGLIVSANDTWRRLTGGNALQGPAFCIGLNYLDICDAARGDDAPDAHRVAAGIRAVLSGEAKRFSIEYAMRRLERTALVPIDRGAFGRKSPAGSRRHARRHHRTEARRRSAAPLRRGHGRHRRCHLPGRPLQHALHPCQ
jgi:PAS domain-containing protein